MVSVIFARVFGRNAAQQTVAFGKGQKEIYANRIVSYCSLEFLVKINMAAFCSHL
jgi:hypothetical protein